MKRIWRFLALLLVFAFALMPAVPATAEVISTEGKDLSGYTVILHTNDTHGRAVPDSYSGNMGFTAVSALKKEYEAAGAKVILLDAGDTLHGLPFATLEKGASIVELMNIAGYDAMTPGNHDFNYGTDTLVELSKTMKFPLLSSNITLKKDGTKLLKTNTIIEKNGVKYGIFGLSTPETAFKTNPNNVATIEFGNPIQAAKDQVAELKNAGADVIIALSHLGVDKSSEYTSELVAETVEGIDLIVDGHSHSTFEAGLKVKDTLIVSTGNYIQNIGTVIIDSKGTMTAGLVNAKNYTGTDKNIDAVASKLSTEQDKLLSEVIGYAAVTLDGVRENVRSKETNLGDLTTDAIRWATGADVALTNGGGIRASIDIGDITKKDLVTVFPFGNYVVTKYITGEALLQALEVGISTYPEPLGAFPQVSGVTFTIDASKPAGSRVVDAKINGVAVDLKATYLFATNDFVIAGGDGYTMLADFKIVNEYGALEEVLINYIDELGKVEIKVENRINVINEAVVEEELITADETKVDEIVKDKIVKDEIVKDEIVKDVKEEVVEATKDTVQKFETYVVVKGDYLKKIAAKLLGKESEWKKIYEWNKDIIKNPDQIQIGQKLKIFAY